MNVIFDCPTCGSQTYAALEQPADGLCPQCDHRFHLEAADKSLPTCAACGNHELYKRKDFPQGIGMAILLLACVLSTLTYLWYEKWWTWFFLLGSAAVDGILYLLVGDVIVCYRCQAHHRGFTATDAHRPFDISIGERYRQEKIRQEQMKDKPL